MEQNILKAINMKYVNFDAKRICSIKHVNDEGIIVIISDERERPFSNLKRIVRGYDKFVTITDKDTFVLVSPIDDGMEGTATKILDTLARIGVDTIVLDKRNYLSHHASSEDLMLMIDLMKPKYYIPVKGEYRHLYMNSEIALEMGYKPSQIILLDNGQVATFENQKLRSCSMELELHDVMIDGKENWDMAGVVLKDREILSTDGVMILAIGLDAKTKKIINGPDIQTRGLIYVKDAEYITTDVGKILEDTIQEAVANKTYDNLTTRNEIRDKISKYLYKQTAKRPMVLPVILEINNQ